MSAADEPRDVLAPEGAIAWVWDLSTPEGSWETSEAEVDDLEEHGHRVQRVEKDERGEPVVRVAGTAHLADVVKLTADVHDLRERLHWIETRLQGAGAVIAGGDR